MDDLRRSFRSIPFLAALLAVLTASGAQAQMLASGGFKLTGDFRARLEADFDSQTAAGVARDDRTRLRVRVRLGLDHQASERFSFGLRLRSGSDLSHQSAHVTVVDFDGNDTGDAEFNFDKWFLKAQGKTTWGWIGRNSLPFWKQNELFWDDDVTPVGLAGGYKSGGERGFELHGGYFSLPVGMRRFTGNLGLVQGVFRTHHLTVAGGLLAIDADPGDPDAALLLAGNGLRDYRIWVASLQFRSGPWTVGADVLHNGESYPASEPLRGEVDGWVGSLKFDPGRGWHAAWYWARIEALAVDSSYAQDDWVRWGSATQTRASNMKGHELRFVKDVGPGQNLVFRLYLAEAITTVEDGSRFRVDYNYAF